MAQEFHIHTEIIEIMQIGPEPEHCHACGVGLDFGDAVITDQGTKLCARCWDNQFVYSGIRCTYCKRLKPDDELIQTSVGAVCDSCITKMMGGL